MTGPKFTYQDVRGVMAYPPTPARDGADHWSATDTVDLAETERMIRQIVRDGADSIALNGTLGEMATLTLDEWKAFAACVAETLKPINPDYPVYIGTTTLNTRDTIDRMRYLRDLGIPGTLLGRPMWGEMVPPVMIQFYRDVAEAVPELAICVYDNTAAFRGIIPRAVYRAMVDIPQIVCVKYAGGASVGFRYHNDLEAVQRKIRLMPIETDAFLSYALYGEDAPAFWSSTYAAGPEPVTYLRDLLFSGQTQEAIRLTDRIRWAHEPFLVGQNFDEFAKYNVPLEKIRVNEAGYIRVGPSRPPYTVDKVPQEHVETTKEHIRRYSQVVEEVRALMAAPPSANGAESRLVAAAGA